MKDFKNSTKKKNYIHNRYTRSANRKKQNSPKSPFFLKFNIKRIFTILGVLVLCLFFLNLFISKQPAASNSSKWNLWRKDSAEIDKWQVFKAAETAFLFAEVKSNQYQVQLDNGNIINYSIDPELQQTVHDFMTQSQVPYALFMAMEPKTGRILAMTSYSQIDQTWAPEAFSQIYPMASLFKIITVSAALEQNKITTDDIIKFGGKLSSENPAHWLPTGKKYNQLPLIQAMAKSANPVFGRLAYEFVGANQLVSQATKFGFNQELFPGTGIKQSQIHMPQTGYELALMGAGLDHEVKISPLHVLSIISGIANNGTMMAPYLADEIRDNKGTPIFRPKPTELKQILTPAMAKNVEKLLSATVTQGTSKHAFCDRKGIPKIPGISIAAKTGSINGKEPPGYYSWFAAYAPIENPQIAVVALVINNEKWKIKAPNLGEKGLEAYFTKSRGTQCAPDNTGGH